MLTTSADAKVGYTSPSALLHRGGWLDHGNGYFDGGLDHGGGHFDGGHGRNGECLGHSIDSDADNVLPDDNRSVHNGGCEDILDIDLTYATHDRSLHGCLVSATAFVEV